MSSRRSSFKHQRRILFALLCRCLLRSCYAFSCNSFRSRTHDGGSITTTINSAQDLKLSARAASGRSTAVQLAYCLRLSILTKLRALKSALLTFAVTIAIVSGSTLPAAAAAVTRNQYRVAQTRVSTRQNRLSARQRNAPTAMRASAFIILATFAASSHRASLRQKRVARTTTPFGVINNVSVLGNGVSIIRLSMSLERRQDTVDRLKEMDSRHRKTMSFIPGIPVAPTERARLRQIYQSEYISRGR